MRKAGVAVVPALVVALAAGRAGAVDKVGGVDTSEPEVVLARSVEVPRSAEEMRRLVAPGPIGGASAKEGKESNIGVAGVPTSGAIDVASELVQVVGEVVVDRASNQAFHLVTHRIVTSLGCDDTLAEIDKGAPVIPGRPGRQFPHTCQVVADLRLEDIASAPRVLLDALELDLITQWLPKLVLPKAGALAAAGPVAAASSSNAAQDWLGFAARVLLPALLGSGESPIASAAAAGADQLLGHAGSLLRDFGKCADLSPADLATALAGGALFACAKVGAGKNCPIPSWLAETATQVCADRHDLAPILARAGAWATSAQSLATSKLEPRPRAALAAALAFDVVCAHVDFTAGCPADSQIAELRTIVVALANDDPLAAFVATGNALIELGGDRTSLRRGLRLLGAVLDYARTYQKNADDATQHAQRKAILRSLSQEMSDRNGRGGDFVFSVGGSLRGVAGARLWGKDREFFGPLSLPLGFALDRVSGDGHLGWHFELGLVDLGEYLTVDNGTVRKPDLEDALAFSLTAGVAWSTSLPVFIGVTAGVAPAHQLQPDDGSMASPDDATRASYTVGLTIGAYVPLFDFN